MPTTTSKKGRKRKSAVATLNVAFVLDRSGSMGHIREATIEGFNKYLADLQADELADSTRFTFVQFDHEFEVWTQDKPVKEVAILGDLYQPRGMTALHDAIAKTIAILDSEMKGERADEKALVVVLTDGFENHSQEFAGESGKRRLAEIVRSYEKRGNWTFVYLGANDSHVQDTAASMGISRGNSMSYSASAASTDAAFSNVSKASMNYVAMAASATADFFADANLTNDVRDEDDK